MNNNITPIKYTKKYFQSTKVDPYKHSSKVRTKINKFKPFHSDNFNPQNEDYYKSYYDSESNTITHDWSSGDGWHNLFGLINPRRQLIPYNRMYKSYDPANRKQLPDEKDYYSKNFTAQAYADSQGILLVGKECTEGKHQQCGSRCCAKDEVIGSSTLGLFICQKTPSDKNHLCYIA